MRPGQASRRRGEQAGVVVRACLTASRKPVQDACTGYRTVGKKTTYTSARANFAQLCDEVSRTREPIIIHRRGASDVALVAAEELESLTETAHLLRSPKNARRLLTALQRAKSRKLKASSLDQLRHDIGLAKEN